MFASTFRLDIGITVRPKKPVHIETILSTGGLLPIFIDYFIDGKISHSAQERIHTALEQHDRVREISFEGTRNWMGEFFRATKCPLPILEVLRLRSGFGVESKLPNAFLGGPGLSHLHLRHLQLERFTLTSVFRFLLSTSALTNLDLKIDTAFGTSPEMSLLTCLQGMPCLRHLDLLISSSPPKSSPPPTTLKDIVPLSKLISFRYDGYSVFLDAILAGLSAPFLGNLTVEFRDEILSPTVHLPRFISETEQSCHIAHAIFRSQFRLAVVNESEFFWLLLKFHPDTMRAQETIMQMSDLLTTKLTTVEHLRISLYWADARYISWRKFYQRLPSVKVLWSESTDYSCIARTLVEHADDLSFLPALEQIELGDDNSSSYKNQSESKLAFFDPFTSARKEAGRPVKVSFRSGPRWT